MYSESQRDSHRSGYARQNSPSAHFTVLFHSDASADIFAFGGAVYGGGKSRLKTCRNIRIVFVAEQTDERLLVFRSYIVVGETVDQSVDLFYFGIFIGHWSVV